MYIYIYRYGYIHIRSRELAYTITSTEYDYTLLKFTYMMNCIAIDISQRMSVEGRRVGVGEGCFLTLLN